MLFLDKFWWDKFRWHACAPVAVALLFGAAGNPGWASNPETLKPCSSPSTRQSIRQKEESHSAESPRADPAEKDRPERKSVAAGFCLAYFAQNLVSDQKTIWTSPLHLHALHGEDKNWLVPFGAGTLGLVAADRDIMRHFGSSPLAHSNSFSN